MYSLSNRLNQYFFLTLTILAIGCCLNYLTALYFMPINLNGIIKPELTKM